jgi:hypothetical protein
MSTFPDDWTLQQTLTSDNTLVDGSSDHTEIVTVFDENSILEDSFTNSQGREINTNYLLNDANLQGYWRLADATDESSNSYDLSGTAPTYTTGKFGNGGDFEAGSSQYLAIADASCANLEISGSQTWSMWIKPESFPAGHMMAMSKDNGGATAQMRVITSGSSAYVRFALAGLTTNILVDSAVVLQTGKWYHCVGVYDSDATKLKIWLNGVKKEVTASGSHTDTNADFHISGWDNAATEYFDGIIDDVAIWDRALTDQEVFNLYTGGCDIRITSDLAGTTIIPHEIMEWDTTNSTARVWVESPTMQYDTDEVHYLWTNNTSTENGIGRELATWNPLKDDANLQGYWKLEDNTDSSSNGYDLTENGTPTYTAGKFSNAAELDGSTDYFTIADASCANLEIASSQTWSAWVNYDANPTGGSFNIMSKRDAGAIKQILVLDGGKIRTRFDGLSTAVIDSDIALEPNVWFHVAFVFNDTANTRQIWINGVKKESTSITGTMTDTNGIFNIGIGAGSGDEFDGQIDDVAVWDRALTDVEILGLYGSGVSAWKNGWVRAYHMDESGLLRDSTVTVDSLVPTATPSEATGKVGGGVDMDLNDYFTFSDEAIDDGCMMMWFNPDATFNSGSSSMFLINWNIAGSNNGDFSSNLQGGDGRIRTFGDNSSSSANIYSNASSWTGGTWYHWAYRWGASGMNMLIDGSAQTDTDVLDARVGGHGTDPTINDVTSDFVGKYDELLISSIDHGDDFLGTMYNNQNDPSTFWTGAAIGGAIMNTMSKMW